ncbi:MAG: DUF4255 domain-containing protein [Lachnospiraceae bacterium]|nr:DUF4255 domain-containing protein [Lachnospiraceae bacterium]
MGNYTIIAGTGRRLVEVLQNVLVPDLVQSADEIGLRSPEDRGDVVVGAFLYDVRLSEEVFQHSRVVTKERISKPPVLLSLYYMITAYSKSDAAYRLMRDELILGRIIQYFYDNPILLSNEADPHMAGGTELHVQMLNPDTDERSKIWNFPNVGNRLSLFYKISPVAIDSTDGKAISKVTEMDINVILQTN